MKDALNERLAEVLDTHFDPRWGSPWWCDHAGKLGFDPRREIVSVEDLPRLGAFPLAELAARPLLHFIPLRYHDQRARLVTSETGGTTGAPKRSAFLDDEFTAAFVTPFIEAANLVQFPRDLNWLFIGPSGPHIIGKAARACALAMGSLDPFMVDFDPRWARTLHAGSLARARYLEHVVTQALDVLRTQDVGVLFATPPVLDALGARMEPAERDCIRGVHLGGMRSEPDFLARLQGSHFPNAVCLGGYGNSLMGLCPEVPTGETEPCYFAHGNRMIVSLEDDGAGAPSHVRYHRLDCSMLLPNVMERDVALPCDAPPKAIAHGFHARGLRDPQPPAGASGLGSGLY